MKIQGYVRAIYKHKIVFASVNSVNAGNRWAMAVPTKYLESITILDETVNYFDGIVKHVNKIGKRCEIEVDADFARRVGLNGV